MTFQPFFQGPGGVLGSPRLYDEKQRRIEAAGEEAGSIRAPPFPRYLVGEAPQHEIAALVLGRLFGDQGKGETERGRALAVGFGPDFMQSPAFEPAEGSRPLPGRERTWEGARSKRAGRAGRGRARCGGDWPETREPARARGFARVDAQSGPSPLPRLLLQRQKAERGHHYRRLERRYARYSPQLSFLFCSRESRGPSQGRSPMVR